MKAMKAVGILIVAIAMAGCSYSTSATFSPDLGVARSGSLTQDGGGGSSGDQ